MGRLTPFDAAISYAERGWRVVPLRAATRLPAMERWPELASNEVELIHAGHASVWDHGVGIATGRRSGVWVLDIDVKDGAGGDESLADLERTHGPLPHTVEAITGTGGRHIYFRQPAELDLRNSAGKIGPGLDVRATGGFVVAPPTINATTGIAYEWDAEHHPDDTPVADAPAWLIVLAQEAGPARTTPRGERGPAPDLGGLVLARDRFDWSPQAAGIVAAVLASHGWQEGRPDRSGTRYWTRPGKRLGEGHGLTMGELANPAAVRVWTSSAPPLVAETSYDPFALIAALDFAGDRAACEAYLVERGWGAAEGVRDLGEAAAPSVGGNPRAQVEGEALHLPDGFWSARPVLGHIRQAAWARLVSPDAVLGFVLTRIAAITSHTVELPAIVGTEMGLTFYSAAVGPPSAGKTAAAAVAASLVPAPSHVLDNMPVGSGEGFVDALFEMVDEEDANGKKQKVKRQTRYAAVFHIDEGTVLGDLSARSGSTIMPTLRSAFTHGTLGSTNAGAERKRRLEGHSYVYGVGMGIQPEKAGPLLSDAAAGTPQRFLWLMATDPSTPDAPVGWPGEIGWRPPDVGELAAVPGRKVAGISRQAIALDPSIWSEVRQDRLRNVKGGRDADGEGDAHVGLVRLKAAALLALLDKRLHVTVADWELAGAVVDASRAVRGAVEASLRHVERTSNVAYGKRLAEREAVVEDDRTARAMASATRSVARKCRQHAPRHSEGTCARSCLNQAVSGTHRKLLGLDEILAEAASKGWISVDGDRWAPGESAPA